jgi:hypothetical protein
MGLVLIGAGVGLLYAGINDRAVVDAVWKWWPLVFVLLGFEVLCQTVLNRDEGRPLKVKYDVFSIFIILVLVGCGLGLQALDETGAAAKIKKELTYGQYQFQTGTSEISLGSGVNRIVIDAPPCHLAVHSGGSGMISAYGQVAVRAASAEDARGLVDRDDLMISRVSGQAQYISFNIPSGDDGFMQECNLLIPPGIEVQIHDPSSAHIFAGDVNNNWKIDGGGPIEVSLSQQANLEITALLPPGAEPEGNVPWQVAETKPETGESNADEENATEYDTGEPSRYESRRVASVKLGAGTYRMNLLLDSGSLTVNQL